MAQAPIVVTCTLPASPEKVWQALTDRDQMKEWYFDLAAFKPEVGFTFQFTGGTEENSYLHLCEVTEVIPRQKLTYSWRYEGYPGITYVTFALLPVEGKTQLTLTHTGLETFPQDNPDFAAENFVAGWQEIIGQLLPAYLEKDPSPAS
ncbi:SRPBCC domain-containing protein [Rufibacter glacialis]|uniref:SRPBCC domain-containing protein n=1 Tax=Rufibacter glacialis TaxID=1259555 RepID=A0A5M8Q4E8_9BACT|nr:SRPBCC domain-containing protein [Rufibacter glacialis]KAA6430719.1 SRPBCC domain-containing protein [Rufibacter glacialis]GGK86142.1 activator of HSP90 ATPase [Rufibacter glacialis]